MKILAVDYGASRTGLAVCDPTEFLTTPITPQITLTGHILVIHSLYINEKFYQSLPEQDKAWFNEAAKRAADDIWQMVEEGDAKAIETIKAAKGSVNTPSKEFHDYMVEAGKRSWKLFYDTVPNAKEILESAASYRDAN